MLLRFCFGHSQCVAQSVERHRQLEVAGYQAGWDKAFNLAIRIENELNADEPTDEEIETCARGFFEGTPGPTNWDAVSEVSKQAWLHAAKKALAAVNTMKTEEES